MRIHLIWDECALTIAPLIPEIAKALTYTEKSFEAKDPERPWERGTVYRKVQMFKEVRRDAHNQSVVQTFQGLWQYVKITAEALGHEVIIHDHRLPFPKPQLDRMGGFRFGQRQLLESALGKDCSGLIKAPTRYGKTYLMLNTLKAYPNMPSIVTAPGIDLVKQLYDDLSDMLPGREVKKMGAGSRVKYQGDDITVVSVDSLHKCEPNKTRLVLIDEPHMAVTNSRLPMIHAFHKARRIGYGATLDERYDNRGLVVQGLIGPILSERSFPEAVAEGAVAPLRVILLEVPIEIANYGDHKRSYKVLLHENEKMARLVARIAHEVLPAEWQSIMFIKNEKQAEFYKSFIGEQGTIAMAKNLSAKERTVLTNAMREDKVKRCLATDIYATGVTFNHVRVIFNLCGGGPYASTIQKPGRVVEVRDGKRCGVLFDFKFVAKDDVAEPASGGPKVWSLIRESKQRHACYEHKGYDITVVKTFAELKAQFEELCL
jgi:superfamily II DNA or RNA helicase